jgi:hypothetical protein
MSRRGAGSQPNVAWFFYPTFAEQLAETKDRVYV